jgi:hypothetical protein
MNRTAVALLKVAGGLVGTALFLFLAYAAVLVFLCTVYSECP